MKVRLLAFLFLISVGSTLHAQIKRDFLREYTDGIVDSVFRSLDVIPTKEGGVALFGYLNQPGEVIYSPGIYRFDDTGQLVNSIAISGETNILRGVLAQAPDSSFWIAAWAVDASNGDDKSRIIHVSADLDEVLGDRTYDIVDGSERAFGIGAFDSGVYYMHRSFMETEFSTNDAVFTLVEIDPVSMDIVGTLDNALPAGSSSGKILSRFVQVDGDRLAMAARARDTAGVTNDFIINEFATTDLSIAQEWRIPGAGGFFSGEFVYTDALDAYAVIGNTLETLVINRNGGTAATIDTVQAPAGTGGFAFGGTINLIDSTFFAFTGRNAYTITISGDSLPMAEPIGGFQSNNRFIAATGTGLVVNFPFSNGSTGMAANIFNPIDTTSAMSPAFYPGTSSSGVSRYLGVSAFRPGLDRATPYMAMALSRTVDGNFFFNHDLIDPETGDPTGTSLGTQDFDWYQFFEPNRGRELTPPVGAGDFYLTMVNEGNRLLFFRYTDSLTAVETLDTNSNYIGNIGFPPTGANGFLFDYNSTTVTPTTYGMLGVTWDAFFDPNAGQFVNTPYIFTCDTNLNVTINTIDTINWSNRSPFRIAVDSLDRIYGVGIEAVDFGMVSNTLQVTSHNPDGSLRNVRSIVIPGFTSITVSKTVFSNDESTLLISGTVSDTSFSSVFGYVALLDLVDTTAEATVVTLSGADLGYARGFGILQHQAVYDAQGNLVLVTVVDDPDEMGGQYYDLRAFQLDAELNVIGDVTLLEAVYRSPIISSVFVQDSTIYISGTNQSNSFVETKGFLTSISPGVAVSTEEPNITQETSFTIYPNPTTSEMVNVSWEQAAGGSYELRLLNTQGQVLRHYRGARPAGQAQFEMPLTVIPKGTYFIRIDVPGGFMIQPVIKQ